MELLFSNPLCLAIFLSTKGVLLAFSGISAVIAAYVFIQHKASKPTLRVKMLEKTGMNTMLGFTAALFITGVALSWTTFSQVVEITKNLAEESEWTNSDAVEIIKIKQELPAIKMDPPKLESPKIEIKNEPIAEPETKPFVGGVKDGKGEQKPFSNGNGEFKQDPPAIKIEPPVIIEQPYEFVEIADKMPKFCGCDDKGNEESNRLCSDKLMTKYLANATDYPAMARDLGYEGKVFMRFIVEKDGSLSNIEILKDMTPGGGLAASAKKAVQKMAKDACWNAGEQRGRKVRVRVTIPVVFKLAKP